METDKDRAAGAAGDEGQADETSRAVPLLALDARALISWFASVLAGRAWVDMGLLADPIKGEVSKDMESARLAIDAYECLVKCLRGRSIPDEARELDVILADLRLNFVRQAGGD
jgi:hypothetical protein